MNSQSDWANAAQQMQQTLADSWQRALQSFQTINPTEMMKAFPASLGQMPSFPALPQTPQMPGGLTFNADKLQALQKQYAEEATALWNQGMQGKLEVKDKRFSGDAWQANPLAGFTAAAYLLNGRALMGLADAVEGDEKLRARVRFAVEQWMAASAPSNFLALNADAQKKAIATKGESIAKGMENFAADLERGGGQYGGRIGLYSPQSRWAQLCERRRNRYPFLARLRIRLPT